MAFRSPSFEAVQEAHIGNVVLGRAPVKIMSSICAATVEEMIEQAKAIEASGADGKAGIPGLPPAGTETPGAVLLEPGIRPWDGVTP